jgi:tripartite-type tricarboxylate transporter receptor subunit TctC
MIFSTPAMRYNTDHAGSTTLWRMIMRMVICSIIVTVAALLPGQAVYAQSFPKKLVRIVIPFSLGGSSDTTGRILLPSLTERWKQQVIIEPRPGASSTVGTDYVSKSTPDGHTLLFTSTQFAYAPSTFKKLPYDPLKDLVPVTLVTISPQMIIAHPSLPVNNPRELIAFAKKHPGQLNLGNAGSMLPTHYFLKLANLKITPVPYKGAGPLTVDLMGGHVPLAMAAISSVQGVVRAGKAKVIGVCSLTPSPAFPDAPVIAKDVPGFEAIAWFGLFAPRGTPAGIVTQVRNDVAEVLKIKSVRTSLDGIGGQPSGMAPDAFAKMVRAEITKWNKVALDAGFKPQ